MFPDFAIYAYVDFDLQKTDMLMFVQKRFCRISTSMKFAAQAEL